MLAHVHRLALKRRRPDTQTAR